MTCINIPILSGKKVFTSTFQVRTTPSIIQTRVPNTFQKYSQQRRRSVAPVVRAISVSPSPIPLTPHPTHPHSPRPSHGSSSNGSLVVAAVVHNRYRAVAGDFARVFRVGRPARRETGGRPVGSGRRRSPPVPTRGPPTTTTTYRRLPSSSSVGVVTFPPRSKIISGVRRPRRRIINRSVDAPHGIPVGPQPHRRNKC